MKRKSPERRARVITGGVAVPLSTSLIGTISEMLVIADLLARGWEVFIPIRRAGGHDLIAVRHGRIRSFEVRSGHRGRKSKDSLTFNRTSRDKSDHYAVVVTGEAVSYLPELPFESAGLGRFSGENK